MLQCNKAYFEEGILRTMSVSLLLMQCFLANIRAAVLRKGQTKSTLLNSISRLDFLNTEGPTGSMKTALDSEALGSEDIRVVYAHNTAGYADLPFEPLPFFFGRQDVLDLLYRFFTE